MARANALYYATRDPFADFTTSPEITQVFGEVLGLWAAVTWGAMGRPDPVLLVECGPGRGTLMADALRAAAQAAPDFRAALRVHLVESSPRLRAVQAAAVPGATWHDGLEGVPAGPMLLLANEFLDALPVRQFVRREDGWMERFVEGGASWSCSPRVSRPSPSPSGRGSGGGGLAAERAVAGAGSSALAAGLAHAFRPLPRPSPNGRGSCIEWNQAAQGITAAVAARVVRDGGAAVFLDYGPERSGPGDSLQALRGGRPADPLEAPGECRPDGARGFRGAGAGGAAAGAAVHGPVPQGKFLAALGLFQRTGRLARTQPPARAAALVQAAQRLAEPDRMGAAVQGAVLAHPALPVPAGVRGMSAGANGPEALTSPALQARHGFFTRRGGVSTGPFASLNCSLSGGDDRALVQANRRRRRAQPGVQRSSSG